MKRFLIHLVLVLFLPFGAFGATYEVVPGTYLEFELPGDRWQVSDTPPDFLVSIMADHLSEEMLKKARDAGLDDPLEVARNNLSVNELFVFNPQSGAWLAVDFSPLRENEPPPSRRAVARSAHFAGQSLHGEEGLSEVTHRTKRVRVPGARHAYRLDAEFEKHEEPIRFIGIVGFADPHWFFLYYTDYQMESQDIIDMEEILGSARLKSRAD
jgi:hypothetical protein